MIDTSQLISTIWSKTMIGTTVNILSLINFDDYNILPINVNKQKESGAEYLDYFDSRAGFMPKMFDSKSALFACVRS